MSKKGEYLRALVTERLTAAAEEIFALFERTIVEYEEELFRSKEENQRKQQLLDSVLSPQEDTDVIPQSPSSCLVQVSPDSPQTSNPTVNSLQDFPCIIKNEVEDLSESDEELEPMVGIVAPMETELDEDQDHEQDYEQDYEHDYEDGPGRSLYSQFNMESFNTGSDQFDDRNPLHNSNDISGPSNVPKGKLKKHQCYFCEKKFKDRHSLKRHTVVHTGEKPFQCPVCAKSYSYKETLMAHMSLHGLSKKPGEKPVASTKNTLFTCPICTKTVTTSFALRSHILIHTGEKPYSCPVCNKRFSQKVYVRKHMRTHTGEKPFSCTACDMKFSRKSNLNRHLKVHAHNALKSKDSANAEDVSEATAEQSFTIVNVD